MAEAARHWAERENVTTKRALTRHRKREAASEVQIQELHEQATRLSQQIEALQNENHDLKRERNVLRHKLTGRGASSFQHRLPSEPVISFKRLGPYRP